MIESYKRIAEVYRRQRRLGEAAEVLSGALELLGAQATSLTAAQLDASLGALALDRGDASLARTHYQRAATIYAALGDPDTLELALARFGHARALTVIAGALTPEARALADDALAILTARGPAFAAETDELRTWLGAHPH
jgi:tetratricopeptide (TPR) repeat protein